MVRESEAFEIENKFKRKKAPLEGASGKKIECDYFLIFLESLDLARAALFL